jgi:hypothetical protein
MFMMAALRWPIDTVSKGPNLSQVRYQGKPEDITRSMPRIRCKKLMLFAEAADEIARQVQPQRFRRNAVKSAIDPSMNRNL